MLTRLLRPPLQHVKARSYSYLYASQLLGVPHCLWRFQRPDRWSVKVQVLLASQELGADETVDYSTEDFSTRYKDQPFDVIMDSVGGATCLNSLCLH